MDDMVAKCTEASAFLKVLANPNRLAILCALQTQRYNVSELTELIGMPQAAMSTQLAVLRAAILVDCEVNHRERRYYISDDRVSEIIGLMYSFFCADLKNKAQEKNLSFTDD